MRSKRLFSGALALIAIQTLLCITACQSLPKTQEPTISFSLVPVADPGGPESLEPVRGSVRNAKTQDRVVLYSYSHGSWWLQPFVSRPFTDLDADFSWRNSIHLGYQYAALLVDKSYKPSAKLETLPKKESGVLAVATAPGSTHRLTTIHFSGYDWEVRQLSSNWGGKLNPYDPNNAWVDPDGFLHLRLVHRDDQWFCADVSLKESLGQGSYSFTVHDVSGLDAAAVLRLYTWDHFKRFNSVISVDVSRWGDPNSKNGQFVIHPSYEPHNIHRFQAPPGVVAFSFRWQPGKVTFGASHGRIADKGSPIAEHTFTSGVPQPGDEKIHISLYAYGNSPTPMKVPAEVIIERFQYAP
jgi:hypothetical protein